MLLNRSTQAVALALFFWGAAAQADEVATLRKLCVDVELHVSSRNPGPASEASVALFRLAVDLFGEPTKCEVKWTFNEGDAWDYRLTVSFHGAVYTGETEGIVSSRQSLLADAPFKVPKRVREAAGVDDELFEKKPFRAERRPSKTIALFYWQNDSTYILLFRRKKLIGVEVCNLSG